MSGGLARPAYQPSCAAVPLPDKKPRSSSRGMITTAQRTKDIRSWLFDAIPPTLDPIL